MASESGWSWSDTAVMAATVVLPLLTCAWVFSGAASDVGNFSPLELDWSAWAGVGIVVAVVKLWLVAGDQLALRALHRGWREQLGGLWSLSTVAGFLLVFGMMAAIGWLAGQIPTFPPSPGEEEWRVAGFVSGLLFLGVERVLLAILVFGLICRRRLGE